MLPHWFDLHTLQNLVAGAAVLCGICALLSLALTKLAVFRFGAAIVFVACAIGLVAYAHGPLQRAETTCHYRFLKSDLAIDGCAHASGGAVHASASAAKH